MKKTFSLNKKGFSCLNNIHVKDGVASYTDLTCTFSVTNAQAPDGLYVPAAWDSKKGVVNAALKSLTTAEEYPKLPEDMTAPVCIAIERPVDGITGFCLTGDGSYVLAGVYLSTSGDLVATDGKRLIAQKVTQDEIPQGYNLQADAVDFMLRNTKKGDIWLVQLSTSLAKDAKTGTEERRADGREAILSCGRCSVRCACIGGDFPAYEKFFPKDHTDRREVKDEIRFDRDMWKSFSEQRETIIKAYKVSKDFRAIELHATEAGGVVAIYKGTNDAHRVEMLIGTVRDNAGYERGRADAVSAYAAAQRAEYNAREALKNLPDGISGTYAADLKARAQSAVISAEAETIAARVQFESGRAFLCGFNPDFITASLARAGTIAGYNGKEKPLTWIHDSVRIVALPTRIQ